MVKVVSVDVNKKTVKIYDSLSEAERYGYNRYKIKECCRGVTKRYKFCRWYYYEDYMNMVGDNSEKI